jgi:hypothetical protein
MPEYAIAIAQEKARRCVPGKCFSKLLCRPLCRWMSSDREVNDATTSVCQDQEDIEDLEANGGNRKEVDRNHVFYVVLQKCFPGLRGREGVNRIG